MTHKQNKYRKSSHSRKFIITSELVKTFEVDSSHMPLSSEVKSSRMWPSGWRLTWGRFQPQVGSRFCTAATRRSSSYSSRQQVFSQTEPNIILVFSRPKMSGFVTEKFPLCNRQHRLDPKPPNLAAKLNIFSISRKAAGKKSGSPKNCQKKTIVVAVVIFECEQGISVKFGA